MLISKSFYHKISDEQWKIIEPHLPKPKSTPGINPPTWIDWGVFEKILQSLVENSRKYLIDSKFCKVHQPAAGARKIHALVNEHFQLVSVELSGGNVHDSEMAIKVLSKITLEGKKILADKGYCSEEIRNFISQEKAEVCIPAKSNAVVIHTFVKELYKSRNIIERFFQRIKNYRHVATRYDKLSNCFLNFIILAAVMIQI